MRKNIYRVKNWSEYNRSLINRGNLTAWFDEGSLALWRSSEESGRRGRNKNYSDHAIECGPYY